MTAPDVPAPAYGAPDPSAPNGGGTADVAAAGGSGPEAGFAEGVGAEVTGAEGVAVEVAAAERAVAADLDVRDEAADADDETGEPTRGFQQHELPEPTGDPRVDGALDRLADLDDLPTSEHVSVFEDVHRRLQSALADLEPES